MFLLAISTIPVYAQNIHYDEKELQIQAEIKECEEKIASDDTLTDASKTVQKRECSSEIRQKYTETAMSFKLQDEMKIKLQNLQKCNDWHSEFQFLNEANFKIQKNSQIVQGCIFLYNDPLWKYVGDDREQILSDKLDEFMSSDVAKTSIDRKTVQDIPGELERIYALEKKVAELEVEIENKNMIIREQMNVISNLANSLRNAIFDGIQSVYPFV